MRLRLDGIDSLSLREARLALRVAGFIVVEGEAEADYIVEIIETEDPLSPITITGADGPFERLAINKIATPTRPVILARSAKRNDAVISLTIPPLDDLRRILSRALVEIFLSYVSHPAVVSRQTTVPHIVDAIGTAQAQTLAPLPAVPDPTIDLLTQRLVDLTRSYVETVETHQITTEDLARTVLDVPLSVAKLHAAHDELALTVAKLLEIAERPAPPVAPPWWAFWRPRG